jgi:hypothetical protein
MISFLIEVEQTSQSRPQICLWNTDRWRPRGWNKASFLMRTEYSFLFLRMSPFSLPPSAGIRTRERVNSEQLS